MHHEQKVEKLKISHEDPLAFEWVSCIPWKEKEMGGFRSKTWVGTCGTFTARSETHLPFLDPDVVPLKCAGSNFAPRLRLTVRLDE